MFSNSDEAKQFACDLRFYARDHQYDLPLNVFQGMTAKSCGLSDFDEMVHVGTFDAVPKETFLRRLQAQLEEHQLDLAAAEIVEDLAAASPDEMILHPDGSAFAGIEKLQSLINSGQPAIAQFRRGENSILVKVVPLNRHLPIFVSERLGPNGLVKFNHPLYRQTLNRGPESPFTGSYRKLNKKLGFNPDARRPQYRDDRLADRLICAAQTTLSPADISRRHYWCFDLLIMALDIISDGIEIKEHKLRAARQTARFLFHGGEPGHWGNIPTVEELLNTLVEYSLLDAYREAAELVLNFDPASAAMSEDCFQAPIHLLPSRYGIGYQPSLYGWPGTDEWIARYGDLAGVAFVPEIDPDNLAVAAAISTFKRLGKIRFLDREEAQAYLDGEGRQWIDYWPVVRIPSGLSAPPRREPLTTGKRFLRWLLGGRNDK